MRAVKPANLLMAIVALLAIVFVIMNRVKTPGAPTPVSFGFAHVSVPLGLVLLGFTLLLIAVFFGVSCCGCN